MTKQPVIHVIGLGAFGTHIAKFFQSDGYVVQGYDNGDEAAASRGVNVRTIRGDYSDPTEMRIAYRCRSCWEQNETFKVTGRLVAYYQDDPTIEDINEARQILGFHQREINSPQALKELQQVYGLGLVAGNRKLVLNEDDGLIDLGKILQDARSLIPYRKTNVQKLMYSSDLKKITCILLDGGECVDTSEAFVFITAGVWTSDLLRDARIPYSKEVPQVVGLFTFPVHLTKEHAAKLKGKSALSLIGEGQFTAPLGDELIGWVTWILRPFLVYNLSNQSDDYSVSHYATRAKLEVWTWLQSSSEFHGDQVGTPQHNFDGVTSDQRHQIFRPTDLNAIVATNGSWHGAKKAMEVAKQAMKVFKGEYSIYESGNKVEHPHQPRLDAKTDFLKLDEEASQDQTVTQLHPHVKERWTILKSVGELKEKLMV